MIPFLRTKKLEKRKMNLSSVRKKEEKWSTLTGFPISSYNSKVHPSRRIGFERI
jgi:hypothetical protein